MKYGKQIGAIIYGKGINARAMADVFLRDNKIVIYRDEYASIHEQTKRTKK